MAVDASSPAPSPARLSSRTSGFSSGNRNTHSRSSDQPASTSTSAPYDSSSTFSSGFRIDSSVATASVSGSLSSLRQSLPENPQIYDFSEIRAATNNFLSKRYSSTSSSQSWRCTLYGKEVIIFQRIIRRSMEKSGLRAKLSVICRSHYRSIIKLLGASISGDQIYLVYEFVPGSNLAMCLRNPRNPSYTVLSTWMSRIQIATDVAHGLDYIHNMTGLGLVHKHVKSSGIFIIEPSLNARICHSGAADLCGETEISGEITDEPELRRSRMRNQQFEGVNGYMSPEFQLTGLATQKSDIYAFGVVLLELFSGEEPVKYKYDKSSGEYVRISVVETARDAIGCGGEAAERGLRQWVDRRLKDSFPVSVAEKVIQLALDCVHVDPDKRPDMRRVSGKISKMFLESEYWSKRVKVPTEISLSLAPR